MGIPHLITFLRPFAKLEPLQGYDVIVDGPGLCYHIHYKRLGGRADARNSFEAALSYNELGDAAIEWLDGLRECGAVVKRIYFDGFLPPAKLSTRLERLESQTRQSIDYYNSHPIPSRAPSGTRENAPRSIFAGEAPRAALTNLPPPPFLVPAVFEALGKSEYYKSITEVVPGEADLYCATYLKKHGGLVLTGDSDLLVHDLGIDGSVAFFRDIQVSPERELWSAHSQIYHPTSIAKRLGLPTTNGILSLAFEMSMDSYGTFPKLVAQALASKSIKAHEKMYQDFRKEYMLLNVDMDSDIDGSTMLSIFQSLDPRISEIILQFPALAKLARQDTSAGSPSQDAPHIFLPFLLDCPVRTSAWEMSTSVRQLAYGLVNLIVPKSQRRFTVYEHRRQQKNSSGRAWQLPSISDIPDACTAAVNLLAQIEEKLPQPYQSSLWLAVTICQDLEWSSSLDRIPLSRSIMDQLFALQDPTKYHKNCSWDVMQFLAQIQASYYSFRILKQIIALLLSHEDNHLLPGAVRALHTHLDLLPKLCDVIDLNVINSLYRRIDGTGMLNIAYEVLGVEEHSSVSNVAPVKSPRKKRKRKGLIASNVSASGKEKSSNPFELLKLE